MDFRQSNTAPVKNEQAHTTAEASRAERPARAQSGRAPKWLNWLTVACLFGIAVLLLLMTLLFARGQAPSVNEGGQVDTSKYQAVFLNNGQVYFGKIAAINSRYVRLTGVYYLTQSATGNTATQASSDYTLVKLGCQQIHYPTDQMMISRDQVTFWENLEKDGKVAKSISDFKQQYPKGPDCTQQTSQTPSANTPSQATPSTTTGTTNNTNTTGR